VSSREAPKRVLHIVSAMDRGGTETLIMNIYRNIDRTKIQFDFVTHVTHKGDYDDEIMELGGKIYRIPSLGQLGPISYVRQLMKLMSSNSFIAVHSHTDYQSGFPTLAAKMCGIKNRICHSHSNNWPRRNALKDKVLLVLLQTTMKLSATKFCSCSMEAAEFIFGEKLSKKGGVSLLKNGIELGSFTDHVPNSKEDVLHELNLPDETKLLGHVGRFSESKNQSFLLKVIKKLVEEDNRYVALLAGDGPLQTQVKNEAERLGIINNVKFLGIRTDIPRLMKAFDVFLFPSIFEGFGIVTIEAQSSGTPCVVANSVPRSTDMGLGMIEYIGLDESLEVWCDAIKKAFATDRPKSKEIIKKVTERGYDIRNNIDDWLELYLDPAI
jgi:glycosyltransferase EpsF